MPPNWNISNAAALASSLLVKPDAATLAGFTGFGDRPRQSRRKRRRPPPPCMALTIPEAAEAMGVSADTFRRHVRPHVKVTDIGRKRMIMASELQRFGDEHGHCVLDDLIRE
jgi:hypothetical protein